MANQFLSLALFLMLLSFFVIMNGLSGFDNTKKELVLNSVSQAFSSKTRETGLAPIDIPNPAKVMNSGDSLSTLQGLFDSHIAHFKATKNRLGTTMHISLTYDEFKEALDNTLSGVGEDGVQEGFMPTMISLLRAKKGGTPYRVDIVLNTPADPATSSTEAGSTTLTDLQRISALSVALEKAGLPNNMITSGLQNGEPGMLDLYFYRHEAFDPLSGNAARKGGKSP